MPKPPDSPLEFGPWPLGMNNRQPDYALPQGTIRNAVNADFDVAGYVKRRSGQTKVYAGANTHSGFSCPAGEFFVEGALLKQLNADNTATTLSSNITGSYVAYKHFNGEVYFSDGVITGRIVGGVVKPWGLDAPPTPTIVITSGSLDAGSYLAAITRVDADGHEHGASEVVGVNAPASSGVQFTNLPSTTSLRLYLSAPNGSTLYMVAELAAGASSYTVLVGRYDNRKLLDTQFVSKPPPGRIIRNHGARMYIAVDKTLWYTEPYAFDRVRLAGQFFQFPQPISVVEPVKGGIWIVADNTYFYAGTGPGDFREEIKLNYGAVFGTGVKLAESDGVMWYSTKGVVVGGSGGEIKNVQEANVAAESGTVGAALVRDKDGMRQFLASIQNPVVSPLVAQSFLEMEVIRKS